MTTPILFNSMKAVIETFRPKQWIKNLFVFTGVLFSQNIFNFPLLSKAISAFVVFCLLSGSTYLFNDLTDLINDRKHPVKRNRPLASGRLNVAFAKILLIVLIPVLLTVSFSLGIPFFVIVLTYTLLQCLYSRYLKHIVILDVFCIACGFVLRVVSGAVVINAEISNWLLVCTGLLALFLALCKRRHELTNFGESSIKQRSVLGKYSPYLLDQMISIVTACTFMSYILYTISDETIDKFHTKNLIVTVPFVLYGIFRYQYLVHKKNSGEAPEIILVTDKPLLINIVLWVLTVGVVLYA